MADGEKESFFKRHKLNIIIIASVAFFVFFSHFEKDNKLLVSFFSSWPLVVAVVIILFRKELARVIVGRIILRHGETELDLPGISEEERSRIQNAIVKNFGKQYGEHVNFVYALADVELRLDNHGGALSERRQTMKAIKDNVPSWGTRVSGDGEVFGFEVKIERGGYKPKIKFDPPDAGRKNKGTGEVEVYFDSLEREREFTLYAKVEFKDSFHNPSEHFTEAVTWPTDRLSYKIYFPDDFLPTKVIAISKWGDVTQMRRAEPLALKVDDEGNHYVRKDWNDPIIGGHFTIEWDWKPPPKLDKKEKQKPDSLEL